MKKRNLFFLILLCLSLVFVLAACNNNPESGKQPQDEKFYWGTVIGTVTENGAGLEGVTVTSGDETTTTDKNGNYSIKVYDNGAKVSFEKEGCITQSKTFKSSSFYTEEIRYDFIMFISTEVRGTVIDKNGSPVSGATVKIGLQERQTNSSGEFVFEQVIGTSMILTVSYNGKSARKPLYTEEMRTGLVEVEISVG